MGLKFRENKKYTPSIYLSTNSQLCETEAIHIHISLFKNFCLTTTQQCVSNSSCETNLRYEGQSSMVYLHQLQFTIYNWGSGPSHL